MAFKIKRFISPLQIEEDPKKPEIKKIQKKVDPDPTKHFKSLGSKALQRTAKNPYKNESVSFRKFAGLQKRLEDSSF